MTARILFLAASEHRVEDDDQLAHASDERNMRLLSLGNQALIEGLETGLFCAVTGYVDGVSHPAAAALDMRSPRRLPLSSS